MRNIIQSHPDVCIGEGETHQIFKGVRRRPLTMKSLQERVSRVWRYMPVLFRERRDLFSLYWFGSRGQIHPKSKDDIDRIFYQSKINALHFTQNMYKSDGIKYQVDEIENGRLLSKNLQGLIFTTEMFHDIYPDATFIGLVRNGVAVCEGHMRRGATAEEAAKMYQKGCDQMIEDAKRYDRYQIFRFEDMLQEPEKTLKAVYQLADLDINKLDKVRFVTKPAIMPDGTHRYVHGATKDELVWYPPEKFGDYFLPNINKNQVKNLSPEQESVIRTCAADALKYFNYI